MYDELYEMLSGIKLYKKRSGANNNRLGFPEHRGAVFGLVKAKFKGVVELSYFSRKFPLIHEEIFRVGKMVCPFEFSQVQVNFNLVCPPHIDKGNRGNSCLVSFGEYSGGMIVIDGIEHNAYHNPIIFNGSQQLHWNTQIEPDLSGKTNKYSLVFFS
jgi:hypothetical protein